MADISLRDYDYEIAAMLDAGEFGDAISHCLHILNIYPKHLQAYRLLGQAFVQGKRGSEAILVYQRILSAVPDEFEAHRLMSTLYEENGNLEAALWHTKRAFEILPADKDIQDRLRQLFTLRDGKAPPMRLTRGALARMYANQPDQTEQAITELRSILSEKPERVDLQLLLAHVYHQTGQDNEAAQVCIAVLKALPHAFEANCILAEIYDAAGQVEQAEVHWKRVKELEPYDKRLENRMVKAGVLTDDNTITVLEEVSGPVIQPGWENSLGIIPSNLVAVSAAPEIHEGAAGRTEPQTAMDDVAAADDDLLAWLNETSPGSSDTIGAWLGRIESKSVGDGGQMPKEPAATPEIPDTSLPLPDWLYSLAKPKAGESLPEPLIETPQDTPDDWLAHLEEIKMENLPAQTEDVVEEMVDETPDWLKSQSGMGASHVEETAAEETSFTEDLIEWVSSEQVQDKEGVVDAGQPALEAELPNELPEWLDGLLEEETPAQDFNLDTSPEIDTAAEVEEPPQAASILESNLVEELRTIPPSQEAYRSLERIPNWLKALEDIPEAGAEAFQLGAEEAQEEAGEILPHEPETKATYLEDYHPEEHLPDWLEALGTMEPLAAEEEPISPAAPSVPQKERVESTARIEPEKRKADIPVKAKELNIEEEAERERAEEEADEKLVEWLMQTQEEIGETALEEPVEEEFKADFLTQAILSEEKSKSYGPGPEWQTDIEELLETSERAIEEQPIEQPLEQMAKVIPPSKPVDQVVKGEEKQEPAKPLPDWLLDTEEVPETIEEVPETVEVVSETIEEAARLEEETETGEAMPDWLAEVQRAAESFEAMVENILTDEKTPRAAQETEIAEVEEAHPSEEIPDWMREIMRENLPEEAKAEEKQGAESGGLPEWLKALEDVPKFREEERQGQKEVEAVEEEPQFENITAAIDWLEDVTERAPETGEHVPQPSEETVPSFEIPQDEFEESQIELTSEEKPPATVSSAWVLESLAAPQALGQRVPMDESVAERGAGLPVININKAGIADLEQLPHIGFRLAQNIINYRRSHGEFHSLDELRNIPKMDAAILHEIASYVHFDDMPVYTESAEYRGEELVQAKNALARGNLAASMMAYNKQIALRANLPEVIRDLLLAAEQHPAELVIWQTLGDAYLQAGSLDEALDSYRKAEEILQ